jgi:hypothetical protein
MTELAAELRNMPLSERAREDGRGAEQAELSGWGGPHFLNAYRRPDAPFRVRIGKVTRKDTGDWCMASPGTLRLLFPENCVERFSPPLDWRKWAEGCGLRRDLNPSSLETAEINLADGIVLNSMAHPCEPNPNFLARLWAWMSGRR